jgi:hypothetical protein
MARVDQNALTGSNTSDIYQLGDLNKACVTQFGNSNVTIN